MQNMQQLNVIKFEIAYKLLKDIFRITRGLVLNITTGTQSSHSSSLTTSTCDHVKGGAVEVGARSSLFTSGADFRIFTEESELRKFPNCSFIHGQVQLLELM